MEEKTIDILHKASQALIQIASFAKENSAVKTPQTVSEYQELSVSLMNIIRESFKK